MSCHAGLDAAASTPGSTEANALVGDLGTINFAVSGDPAVQDHVVRGVKLLHHMMYEDADRDFAAALDIDPHCVLAWWGRAMAIVTPLWAEPAPARLRLGWDYVERGRATPTATARERAYLAVMEAYFRDATTHTERERLEAAAAAWKQVVADHPADLDAKAFCALYSLGPARFLAKDRSYRIQLEAGRMLEEVLAAIPDHPGGHHYRIHAYDSPLLADRAIELCADYGSIAPEVPHALHMPSHIYTRRGDWEKSIEFNLRSVEAARRLSEREGVTSHHYTHGLDYLAYAYLQRGQFHEAEHVRQQVSQTWGPYNPTNLTASAFALAAIPARVALERHDWAAAAQLEPRPSKAFPWTDAHAPYSSITLFARALGAVRSGQLDLARTRIEELERARDQIVAARMQTYWVTQAETQVLTCRAWLNLAEGKRDEAVSLMRRAAEIERSTDKEAVTPGEVLPAGELLGDMLSELGRHAEARAAYEAMLELAPNRLNSLYGAARAADKAGDRAEAGRLYALVLSVAKDADPDVSSVQSARAYIAALPPG
jgi:tetratricopeptide (TPR) repeat protein